MVRPVGAVVVLTGRVAALVLVAALPLVGALVLVAPLTAVGVLRGLPAVAVVRVVGGVRRLLFAVLVLMAAPPVRAWSV